ncbi:WD40 repeat domain-containing protein [bacterium]|nr:WD40 repeat domain-containing protein [bacterium]
MNQQYANIIGRLIVFALIGITGWTQDALENGDSIGPNSSAAIDFSPDGSKLIIGGREGLAIYQTNNGAMLMPLEGHTGTVRYAQYSPDGSKILTASEDHSAILWDAESGAVIHQFLHDDIIVCCGFSPDGSMIFTGGIGGMARVWDGSDYAKVNEMIFPFNVLSFAFSPDSSLLALGIGNGRVHLFYPTSRRQLWETFLTGSIQSLAFLPDGSAIIAGTDNKEIKFINPETGDVLHIISGFESSVTGLDASPDGQYLLACSWDGSAHIYQLETYDVAWSLSDTPSWHEAVFSPTSETIAIGGYSVPVHLVSFDLPTLPTMIEDYQLYE